VQLGTSDALEGKFALLEGNSVDDELSKLKQNVLGGARPAATSSSSLPAGRPIKDAIDFELEELRRKAQG
jgi:phage shock protein A